MFHKGIADGKDTGFYRDGDKKPDYPKTDNRQHFPSISSQENKTKKKEQTGHGLHIQ
jgi:hypothetical protein